MLPLSLLRAALGSPLLVEIRSGETYNGYLVAIDSWMNIHLRDAVCTSRDGQRFWQLSEVFVRGSIIKFMQVPEEVLEKVREEQAAYLSRGRDGGESRYDGASSRSGGSGGSGRGGFRGGARGGSYATGGSGGAGPDGGDRRGPGGEGGRGGSRGGRGGGGAHRGGPGGRGGRGGGRGGRGGAL